MIVDCRQYLLVTTTLLKTTIEVIKSVSLAYVHMHETMYNINCILNINNCGMYGCGC